MIVAVVVERSKKCWDYCTTIFILHLAVTTITHVPFLSSFDS